MSAPEQKPIGIVGAGSIKDQLEEISKAVRRGDYSIIGAIEHVQFVDGAIKFTQIQPGLASLNTDGSLAVITPFEGLPDDIQVTKQRCTACMAKCDVCEGKKIKECSALNCDKDGKRRVETKPCPKCLGGPAAKTDEDCAKCNGRGEVPIARVCRSCKGTRRVKCEGCEGTGRRSYGKEKASRDNSAPRCKACLGYGRKIVRRPQLIQKFRARRQFVQQRNDKLIFLGPITSIRVKPVDQDRSVQIFADVNETGQPMLLVFEHLRPGARMWLVGGKPTL